MSSSLNSTFLLTVQNVLDLVLKMTQHLGFRLPIILVDTVLFSSLITIIHSNGSYYSLHTHSILKHILLHTTSTVKQCQKPSSSLCVKIYLEASEMVRWLRTLTALLKDIGSIPTPTWQLRTIYNPSNWGNDILT